MDILMDINGRLARVFFFFDAPGYGTQTDRRHFRLESEPGRAEPKGTEWGRMEPSGANRETGEGDERAIRFDAMFQPPDKTRDYMYKMRRENGGQWRLVLWCHLLECAGTS